MPVVVGVSFRKIGKVYYFEPNGLDLHEGDFVITETAHGLEFGEIVLESKEIPENEVVSPLKKVVRIANSDDLTRESSNRDREKWGMEVCEQKIVAHNLPMKLLDAECSFDGAMITFSFSADGRIDFRELVRDVASVLKTRVQLHQIGVRDEARIIGGYGACGRPLCCTTFLTNFEPVSMKMAKDQSLFLNPAKFSGCCGKLLCCLRFEHDFYKDARETLPSVGAILQFDGVRGKVVDVNVISEELTLETEDGVQINVNAHRLELDGTCKKHGITCDLKDKNCQEVCLGESLQDKKEYNNDELILQDDEPYDIDLLDSAHLAGDISGIKFRDVGLGSSPDSKKSDPEPSAGQSDQKSRNKQQSSRDSAPKNRRKKRNASGRQGKKPKPNNRFKAE